MFLSIHCFIEIELKSKVYKEYIKKNTLYYLLQILTSKISSYISKCKSDNFKGLEKNLGDFSRSIKSYWATLKTSSNGRRVPFGRKVYHSLLVNNEPVTEFQAKANIFNNYYPNQCTAINNKSILP